MVGGETIKKKILEALNSILPISVDIKADTVNVANKKKIVFVDASSSTTVAAGSQEVITIQPPQGKIWRLIDINIVVKAPSGATTGSHQFNINLNFSNYGYILISSGYSSSIILQGAWPDIYSTIRPSTADSFLKKMLSITLSNTYYLVVTYTNSTDADQTNSRVIQIWFIEEDEAP